MKMDKKKKLLISIIVLVAVFIVSIVVAIALWSLEIISGLFWAVAIPTFLVLLSGFIDFLFAFYINEVKRVREAIKENDYNLHRKKTFYNYSSFTSMLNSNASSIIKNNGYFVVFKAVNSTASSTLAIDNAAEFNGYLSDYISKKLDSIESKKDIKQAYYCFYRGNFVFYLMCDNNKLNQFVTNLENEVYRIIAEKDFHLRIQPCFGIYEHVAGNEDSVYDMTDKANAAREVARRNYESIMYFTDDMLNNKLKDDTEEIVQALNNNEFVVYYQPKYNIAAKRFTSSEALIRWNSPTRGLLSPMRFINTAENGGLIHKIDMFVFEQVCKDLDETRRKGRRLIPVSINFSLYEFYSPNFVEDIISIIEKNNINPALLEIEVLEGTTGVNLFLSISILKKLKEYGLRILMDDFGVGYSNFNNLKNLPIDVVKIDKSFIDNIVGDVKSREIVKFMIEFSKEIGLEVVAEGVDNEKQVEILKKYRCDTIQGFYYSKPLPRGEFEKFIAKNDFEKRENLR